MSIVDDARGVPEQQVRQVLSQHGGLAVGIAALGLDDDLYAAGMSSRASVSVMLALESAFEIEFPDAMLRREVFASIGAMCDAIEQLVSS